MRTVTTRIDGELRIPDDSYFTIKEMREYFNTLDPIHDDEYVEVHNVSNEAIGFVLSGDKYGQITTAV